MCKNDDMFGENYPEHDRARRESSRRETRGKMIAVAFSRWHFLRVRGPKNRKTYKKTPDPPPQAADMLGQGQGQACMDILRLV